MFEQFRYKMVFMQNLFSNLFYPDIPSLSSKRGHVTVKHVLTGRKHDKLGNQTFEVLKRFIRYLSHISLISRVAAI